MKKIMILCIAYALMQLGLNAQNRIDPPKLFNKDNIPVIDYRNNLFLLGWNWSSPSRNMDNALFMNTYHNLPHHLVGALDTIGYTEDIADSIRVIEWIQIPGRLYNDWRVITGRNDTLLFNGMSLQLDPTITIDKSDDFKQRTNDSIGSVYGFQYKNWTVGDTVSSGIDQHRFILKRDSLTLPSAIVLNKIWDGTILRYQDYDKTNFTYLKDTLVFDVKKNEFVPSQILKRDSVNTEPDIQFFHPYNGKQYYLSINLRALDETQLEQHLNDVILSIRLPYNMRTNDLSGNLLNNTSGLVRFDSVPRQSQAFNRNIIGNFHNDFRGVYRELDSTTLTNVFNITGEMLKSAITSGDNSITLSAFARFMNKYYNNEIEFNPPFKNDWHENQYKITEYIDSIDVEVTYHGKADVAIGWVRLETNNSRRIMFGGRDSLLKVCIDTVFSRLARNTRNPHLYRFYGGDEFIPFEWGSMRYLNMLLDTLLAAEIYTKSTVYSDNPPRRVSIATGLKDFWTGSTISHDWENPAAPFIRRAHLTSLVNRSNTTFGLNSGYAGNDFTSNDTIYPYNNFDSLNSAYETYIIRSKGGFPINNEPYTVPIPLSSADTALYDNSNYSDSSFYVLHSPQSRIEMFLKNYYYNYQNSIYSDLPFIANLWVTGIIQYKSNEERLGYLVRPKTGEEIRLFTNSPLLLGSKGLIYWLKSNDQWDVRNGVPIDMSLLISRADDFLENLPAGTDLIYSDINGGDYMDLDDRTNYHFGDVFTNYKYNWSLLGIQKHNIYLGIKSTTVEMYKTNKWIKQNETQLMNMKLMAWYGKGFLKLYSQDPKISEDTIMKKYIDIANVRTKKLYQPTISGTYLEQETYEHLDSSFFDIAIHRDIRKSPDSTIILAVQNRRTDPLVHTIDTLNYVYEDPEGDIPYQMINSSMKFYSTAEFDKNCNNGGEIIGPKDYFDGWGSKWNYHRDRDTTYWRNLWWRRLGSREISIPLKISDTIQKKLRVIELVDTSDIFKKAPYYTALDTVIPPNGTIKVKYLPGEMKMFKINSFQEDEEPFTGELAFSNQHKLVVYPTKQKSNINFNGKDTTVYYHAVYHKRNESTGKNSVYYRRSFPYNANGYDQIHWERQEKLISTKLVVKREIEPNLNVDSVEVDSCNCKYPSIVVRYDAIDSTQKAYIVYNCEPIQLADTPKVYVVESVIDCDEPYSAIMPSQLIYPIGFAYSNQGNEFAMNTWGVPVVNASANGNFYTWADSIFGIVAGYKTPNDRGYITNKKYIKYDYTEGIKSIQPSLNPYSRIANAENDCALVWAEVKPASMMQFVDSTSIHYTMLKLDGNGDIDNSVPNGILDPSQPRFASVQTNGFGSARIDVRKRGISSYPTVVRPVQYYLRPTREMQDSIHYFTSTWDRVYWEYNPNIFLLRPFINQKMLDINKSSNLWNCLGPYSIFGAQKSLYSPNVMQGTIRNNFTGAGFHQIVGNDSSFVLGFSSQSSTAGIDIANSDIWLFPHGFWNIYYDPIIDWGNIDTVLTPGDPNLWVMNRGKGIYPQLTKSPIVNKTTDWKINSLIFLSVNDSIFSTKQYFYRRNTEDERMKIHPIMSYVGNDGVDESGISFFELNNFNKPNIKFMGRKNDKYEYLDTIQTEWFRIENIEELSFISQNTKNSTAKILIERRKDGKKIEMNPKIFSNSKTSKNRIHLINGKNEQYRILFAKKDNNYKLNLGFMLAKDSELNPDEELIDADRVGKSTITELEDYVDLGDESYLGGIESGIKINLYPNPANDRIYVSAYLPLEYIKSNNLENNQLKLIIVNSIGKEIYKSDINAGETKAIETSTYSNGIYFVKISFNNGASSIAPIQNKMFVIER